MRKGIISNSREAFTDYYTLIKQIGKGSFGTVVHAMDNYSGQEIAVKIIKKRRISAQRLENLRQEAEILQNLHHNNVIQFHHVKESDHHIFLAMEYMEGGSLGNLIKRGPLPEHQCRQIMAGIFRAVEYLHAREIAHRDLKPENILIQNVDGKIVVKVADFGLSAYLYASEMAQENCGTPLYMAPEQANKQGYGKEVDIWSSGIIMFRLLTGAHPLMKSSDTVEKYFQKLKNPK